MSQKALVVSRETLEQPFWAMKIPEVFEALASRPQGLKAKEVQDRQGRFGQNIIQDGHRLSHLGLIWNQLKSPLIAILMVAGFVTLFLREWIESFVIFLAVFLNTALGFWQENKAATILENLKSYVRVRAHVRRQGRELEIDAAELVPGDVLLLAQGDRVPADARLLFVNQLEVDESILTGESLPIQKSSEPLSLTTPFPDRASMVFSGTLIQAGLGEALVTATGRDTELGRIALLSATEKSEPTPLQRSVAHFTAWAGAILAVIVFGLFISGLTVGYGIKEMFLIAVAVAVSAVPEGLPIALTVILAIGVERLAKRKGIVRKLLAAETLGSTSVILTDKTGTLTQAKMELAHVWPWLKQGSEAEKQLLFYALSNTEVMIENPEKAPPVWRVIGRPMEVSLVKATAARGVLLPAVRQGMALVDREPFTSARKFSLTVVREGDHTITIVVGAPEIIAEFTNLSEEEKEQLREEIQKRATGGERVLGVATKTGSVKRLQHLAFQGLLSFRDPVRETVKDAIRRVHAAGVKTVIVSGDHQRTVEAIAHEVGIFRKGSSILTGIELNELRPEELKGRLDSIAAYARVTPEQKMFLVKLYQERGDVVAVTGDGVNDAPALQAADIGVAVGSGTDVAKGAADLVLLDDNFETIVAAIEQGRKILENIRKVIVYLLSNGWDELFLIGGALVAGLAMPLNALQILYVNFFSDSIPAIAFAFEEKADGDGLRFRKTQKNFFDPQMRFLILGIGTLSSAFLFALYFFLLQAGYSPAIVKTFIFASFATYTLFLSFSLRALHKPVWTYHPFSNRLLTLGVLIGFGLTLAAIYIPSLQTALKTTALPISWLGAVVGVGLINIVLVESAKKLFR